MNLEMVSDRREHPLEASVKVLSRLDIRNPVKTSPVQKQAKLLKKCYVQTHARTHRQTFPIIILDTNERMNTHRELLILVSLNPFCVYNNTRGQNVSLQKCYYTLKYIT